MIQRAAIYARYSSDSQREASIDDQIRLCREFVGRHDWTLVQTFHDAALSGATSFRPGYQALVEAANQGQFDVVVAESLDRLSRDQADVAALFKRLKFAGIRIVTLADGDVTELHVGLKDTMNALFLQDLAQKTHRGQRGRIEAGKTCHSGFGQFPPNSYAPRAVVPAVSPSLECRRSAKTGRCPNTKTIQGPVIVLVSKT